MHVFVHGKKPCSTMANIAKVTTIEHRHIEAPYIHRVHYENVQQSKAIHLGITHMQSTKE